MATPGDTIKHIISAFISPSPSRQPFGSAKVFFHSQSESNVGTTPPANECKSYVIYSDLGCLGAQDPWIPGSQSLRMHLKGRLFPAH